MSDVERNKAVAREVVQFISDGDMDSVLGRFDESGYVSVIGNTLLSGIHTYAWLKENVARIMGDASFPDGLDMKVHSLIGEGNFVNAEVEADAMHVSGKRYNQKYIFLFQFTDDGKIAVLKEYLDTELMTEVLCGGRRPS